MKKIKCSQCSQLIPESETDNCDQCSKSFCIGCLTYYGTNSELGFCGNCEKE